MKKITILGAGNIGQAIAHVLRAKKGLSIELWDRDPVRSSGKSLEEVVRGADVVFLCMPSFGVAEAAKGVSSWLDKRAIVVNLAKGIEVKSGRTIDEVLAGSLPKGQSFALLSGPMLAGDLLEDRGGTAVVASRSIAAQKDVLDIFSKTQLKVFASSDVRGVALAGVLKNIYAVGLGALHGMNAGWNSKGIFIFKALEEMAFVLKELGGKKGTEIGPAGIGDLVATGFSPDSRNHQIGLSLAAGVDGPPDSEGMNSLPVVLKMLGGLKSKAPILTGISKLVKDPKNGEKELKKIIG